MDNPGVYTLASTDITSATDPVVGTPIADLEGMVGYSLDAQLSYGASGGTSVVVVVQTSFDGGSTWRDSARVDFAAATAVRQANISAATPKTVTTYAALSAQGVNDGPLGDRLRAVWTITGTYVGAALAVRINVR